MSPIPSNRGQRGSQVPDTAEVVAEEAEVTDETDIAGEQRSAELQGELPEASRGRSPRGGWSAESMPTSAQTIRHPKNTDTAPADGTARQGARLQRTAVLIPGPIPAVPTRTKRLTPPRLGQRRGYAAAGPAPAPGVARRSVPTAAGFQLEVRAGCSEQVARSSCGVSTESSVPTCGQRTASRHGDRRTRRASSRRLPGLEGAFVACEPRLGMARSRMQAT